jgi:hypothetical protein
VLDGECGKLGVGDRVAPEVVREDQRSQHVSVAFGRSRNPGDVRVQPPLDLAPGLLAELRILMTS